ELKAGSSASVDPQSNPSDATRSEVFLLVVCNSMAFMLKFMAYSLLVFHWSSVYHHTQSHRGDDGVANIRKLQTILIASNLLVCGLIIILYAISQTVDSAKETCRMIGCVHSSAVQCRF